VALICAVLGRNKHSIARSSDQEHEPIPPEANVRAVGVKDDFKDACSDDNVDGTFFFLEDDDADDDEEGVVSLTSAVSVPNTTKC
jgi:hypothetical protein